MSRGRTIVAALVVGLLSAVVLAQQPTPPAQQPAAGASMQQPDQPPPMGRGMMTRNRARMMSEMKAADDRLQQLVTKMNAATGDQKVTAMAELLTQLVNDHIAMHQRMMQMGRQAPAAPPK